LVVEVSENGNDAIGNYTFFGQFAFQGAAGDERE